MTFGGWSVGKDAQCGYIILARGADARASRGGLPKRNVQGDQCPADAQDLIRSVLGNPIVIKKTKAHGAGESEERGYVLLARGANERAG
jgi:hypothetical protein